MSETTEELRPPSEMTVPQLKAELREREVEFPSRTSKNDLVPLLEQARASADADVTPDADEDFVDGQITEETKLDELEHEHSRDLAVQETTSTAMHRQAFDERERELIARLVAPGHTADELALFERICIRTGLDPFARQIYSIKRRRRRQVNGQWISEEVATPQTSIDGFRLIAHRTAQYQGQTPPEWYDPETREWVTVWLKDEQPPAARVGVYRRGFAGPLIRTVTWREFGGDTATWKSMPALMLAKCAESQALRAAFPQELSGLYTEEEMGQASEPVAGASYETAMQPIRQEEAGQPSTPKNVHEILERLTTLLGEEEAVEWLREAVASYAEHKGATVSEWKELSPQLRTELGRKLAGVVLDLEELESESGEDLRMSTGVREKVVPVFAKRLDGLALIGPQWRLGPDEENLPTLEEYDEANAVGNAEDENIEFPAAKGEPS